MGTKAIVEWLTYYVGLELDGEETLADLGTKAIVEWLTCWRKDPYFSVITHEFVLDEKIIM